VGAKEASGFPQLTVGAEVAAAVGVLEGFAVGTGVVVYTPVLEQPVVTRTASTATTAPSSVLRVLVLWVLVLWVLVP
jgi:hypothetical protein